MVNTVYPIDNAGLFSGRMLRQALVSPTVAGATPLRPLGGRSGVRPGTSPTTVTTPTATTWACAPHGGTVDVQPAAEAGTYGFAVDASIGGSITAANASNPRIDIVYDQLTDPAEGNGGTPKLETLYLAGAAAPTPQAPAKPARSIVLAQINVPRAGGGNPTVTWVAPYTAGAGGVVDYASKAALLADTPAVNSLGRDIVTGSTYVYHPGATPQATPFWLHVGGRPDAAAFASYREAFWTAHASRGLRLLSQGGRIVMEGALSSTGNVTIDKDKTFIFGNIAPTLAPKTNMRFPVDINRAYGTVGIDTSGVVSFLCTAPTFLGVLEASVDGLSWLDPRLT